MINCFGLEPADQMMLPPAVQSMEDEQQNPVLDAPVVDGIENPVDPNEDFENEVS